GHASCSGLKRNRGRSRASRRRAARVTADDCFRRAQPTRHGNDTRMDSIDTASIAFIGGGNMARSLIGGLLAAGTDPSRVRVADPGAQAREALARDFGVHAFGDAAEAVAGADTWVFAVKPQVMRGICEALAGPAQKARPLVVSIAAGITSVQLDQWLGGGLAVVRTMPNTPALLGAGV